MAVGQPKDFKNVRHFAAYLDLVPRQHSSGGRDGLHQVIAKKIIGVCHIEINNKIGLL